MDAEVLEVVVLKVVEQLEMEIWLKVVELEEI